MKEISNKELMDKISKMDDPEGVLGELVNRLKISTPRKLKLNYSLKDLTSAAMTMKTLSDNDPMAVDQLAMVGMVAEMVEAELIEIINK